MSPFARSCAAVVEAGAAIAAREPWRITRAVYGAGVSAIWPPYGKTVDEVRSDCHRFLRAQRQLGAAHHWCFDRNRLIALRQAERALTMLSERAAA